MSIEAQGLTKSFGSQTAVDDLSFQVRPGEVVGFLGPNGAGKSTTMRILTGYQRPDLGQVTICGKLLHEDGVEVRAMLGYLPENNPLYGDMYVREYLRFVAQIHRIVSPAQRIDEVMKITGLFPERNKKVHQLSKGYRQRLGICQAIIHDPPVLILDEPISGLDPNQLDEIRRVIRELGSSKAVLFSSHILQEVSEICDRIIVLHQGKKVADQDVDDIRTRLDGKIRTSVLFERAVPNQVLKSIPQDVQVIREGKPEMLELIAPVGNDLRPLLFDLAVKHGIRILEMKTRAPSLENVFHELTRKA